MLDSHPRIHIPRESHFIVDLLERFSPDDVLDETQICEAFQIVQKNKRWREWEVNDSDIERLIQETQPRLLSDFLNILYEHISEKHGKERWADKTPRYVSEIENIAKIFPNAKFIHVIRDGRDVCLSLLNRGWHGRSLRMMAERWSRTVRAGRTSGSKLGSEKYLEVLYEQLVENTEPELKKICAFIREPYSPSMLEFFRTAEGKVSSRESYAHEKLSRPPMSSDLSRWKREMSFIQLSTFEAVSANTLTVFNYPLHFSGIFKVFPFSMRTLFYMADVSLPLRKQFGLHFQYLNGRI